MYEVMLKSKSKLDMTFANFFEIYEEDKKKRVKENTWESKSKAVSFRVSEEEAKFINDCVALSGLTKQDYREHHRKNGIEAR